MRIDRRKNSREGLFVVVDGLDGIGKGEVERALRGFEEKMGRTVFDAISFSRANRKGLPELRDFWNPPKTYYDTVMNAEPTYAGIGQTIRDEITANNGRSYSADIQIQAYGIDRLVNMQRVVIPAITHGVNVIQSRCFATSYTYQALKAQDEHIDFNKIQRKILQHEGNALQLQWAPDLVIIPTIEDTNALIRRLEQRALTQKDDNSIFENVQFQTRLKPLYEGKKLKELFEKHGSQVTYLDAGISEQSTRQQAIEIYKKFLDSRT